MCFPTVSEDKKEFKSFSKWPHMELHSLVHMKNDRNSYIEELKKESLRNTFEFCISNPDCRFL